MTSSSGIMDPNVEDMSNAELFQYLFKAELGSDLPPAFTEALFHEVDIEAAASPAPSLSSSSSLSPAPATSSSSPASSYDSSPVNSTLSYNSSSPSSPYLQLEMGYLEQQGESQQQEQEQEQVQQQAQPLSPLLQFPAFPTLLPSTSFSYRQLTADMPPSMPASTVLPSTLPLTLDSADNQFLNLVHSAPASASSAPKASTDQMTFWMQRFQQLQQLQLHHQQQQQLFASPLFSFNSSLLQGENSNNSTENFSSSSSSSKGSDKNIIYPSPPMKDDMSMESDSDEGRDDGPLSDPLKPGASELKKMTSKERRQLRNKLSARNFRVRRKEYISSLEAQVKEARNEAAELQKKLDQSELNCQFLRQELDTARLPQTLFNGMSREHANLLASLLNPNTESFPTTSPSSSVLSVAQQQQQQQRELMESINHNDMMILHNSLTIAQPEPTSNPEASLQPFVPFDGNWELIVNRAETIVDPAIDPKDVQSKEAMYKDLLERYEAAHQEAERDEQMRTELQAYHDQKLAQTYIVMPKDEAMSAVSSKASQNTLVLQAMVYMMMIHLTGSLFEAATLSKSQLVNMVQVMDGPLRSKMGQEQKERSPCKFTEWREAWIKKWCPSYYNNRRRACELLKNGLCPSTISSAEVDVDETVRKMEEGVKGKTVEPPMTPFCVWLRSCITSWLRCPEQVAREECEALIPKASLEANA
ncbi:hypothetical protein BGZ65_004633 [Modicella reniformis]|uniref:BZIP domain-containing protein n=1 Tax=Modicella reniformis TaxID=1440133 RepID=A0A9P6SLK9_9FUNG|nr:hypothetical protein BGZ65_004633 [Modicella reniformis]